MFTLKIGSFVLTMRRNTPYTTEEYVTLVSQIHHNRYGYEKTQYIKSNDFIIVTCPIHGDFEIRASYHLHGGGCKYCKIISNRKRVCGIGINDMMGVEPMYREIRKQWGSMIRRCCSDKAKQRHYSFKKSTLCPEWIYLSNFYKWCIANNYVIGMNLDKDILKVGNHTYSPDTCCLVPSRINALIQRRGHSYNGNNPIGVIKEIKSRTYRAYMSKNGKPFIIGFYETAEAAFQAYKTAKESYVKEVAQEYYDRGEITKKVYDALMCWNI